MKRLKKNANDNKTLIVIIFLIISMIGIHYTFVEKHNSSVNITDSLIFKDGNVGIGPAAPPSAILHIVGTIDTIRIYDRSNLPKMVKRDSLKKRR